MTENYYTTRNYEPDYSTCSSKIYNYDFDGYISMSDMAKRIISDWNFDKQCKNNMGINNRKDKNIHE